MKVSACFAVGFVTLLSAGTAALAQSSATGIPNAVQGFSTNRDKPIQINATTLEVRDKDKKATFSGAVQVVQGDTTLKCKVLDVYYEADAKGGAKAGTPGPGGQQAIKRLEAKGGVLVVQRDQTATGDSGVFDMPSNTLTLFGNVTITQGQNVVRGDRLVVDLTTGVSRVESGKTGEGGVRALFQPSTAKDGAKDAAKDSAKDSARDNAKDADARGSKDAARPVSRAPQAPLKLN